MATIYSSSQTGTSALWGIEAIDWVIIQTVISFSPFALTSFAILDLIVWILVPLYAKRVRWSYVVGIVVWIVCIVGIAAMLGTAQIETGYIFGALVHRFSLVIFCFVALVGIYFSYRSYKELTTI